MYSCTRCQRGASSGAAGIGADTIAEATRPGRDPDGPLACATRQDGARAGLYTPPILPPA